MNSSTRRTGKKKLNIPSELLEFDSKKSGIIPIMAGTNEDKGRSWFEEKRAKLPESAVDSLPYQIFDTGSGLEAFFLPSPGERGRKDDHGPRRATVAAEWLRVWVKVTSVRVTPRMRARSSPAW
jgi:hypothetical protein